MAGAPNVILLVKDHAADALEDLRKEQRELLQRAAALGRQIATIEAMRLIGEEHQGAESNGAPDAKPASERQAGEKKGSPRGEG